MLFSVSYPVSTHVYKPFFLFIQALAMSHRDEDDPEAIFGERPRRRLNTLELYQIRQFKKPTVVSKQNSANAPGKKNEGTQQKGGGRSRGKKE